MTYKVDLPNTPSSEMNLEIPTPVPLPNGASQDPHNSGRSIDFGNAAEQGKATTDRKCYEVNKNTTTTTTNPKEVLNELNSAEADGDCFVDCHSLADSTELKGDVLRDENLTEHHSTTSTTDQINEEDEDDPEPHLGLTRQYGKDIVLSMNHGLNSVLCSRAAEQQPNSITTRTTSTPKTRGRAGKRAEEKRSDDGVCVLDDVRYQNQARFGFESKMERTIAAPSDIKSAAPTTEPLVSPDQDCSDRSIDSRSATEQRSTTTYHTSND